MATKKEQSGVLRSDTIKTHNFYGPEIGVSLNTLRNSLDLYERFEDIAGEVMEAEGISMEFSEKLSEFLDDVGFKEWSSLRNEIEKIEKANIK